MRTRERAVTEQEIEEMINLREGGLTYKEIAAHLGRGKSTIRYHIAEGEKEKHAKYTAQWKKDQLL